MNKNYGLIKRYMKGKPKPQFGVDDYFLVFNYTHTLQKIYRVSERNIYYVHGECFGSDDDELIIGHGNEKRIVEIQQKIKRLERIYDYTQQSKNEIGEHECLLRYMERLRKDVKFHMLGCKSFYNSFKMKPQEVNVYGMSLGEVDLPYILQIRDTWPDARWSFSYYSNEDKERAEEVARTILKLDNTKFNTFIFNNPVSTVIMDNIISMQNIIKHKKF